MKQGELEMVNHILEHDICIHKVAQLGKEKKGIWGSNRPWKLHFAYVPLTQSIRKVQGLG